MGRVDGKNLRVKLCFSKSVQIKPLNCIRNKWTRRTKQGLEGGGGLQYYLRYDYGALKGGINLR